MRVAFVMYDRMRLIDFASFYEFIYNQIEDLSYKFYALKADIKDDKGLLIKPDCVGESLDGNDMVFIPGGVGAEIFYKDDIFLAWIKTSRFARYKISTNEGTLLLGGAGFLKDKKVSCKHKEILSSLSGEVVDSPFAHDDGVITSTILSEEFYTHVGEVIG